MRSPPRPAICADPSATPCRGTGRGMTPSTNTRRASRTKSALPSNPRWRSSSSGPCGSWPSQPSLIGLLFVPIRMTRWLSSDHTASVTPCAWTLLLFDRSRRHALALGFLRRYASLVQKKDQLARGSEVSCTWFLEYFPVKDNRFAQRTSDPSGPRLFKQPTAAIRMPSVPTTESNRPPTSPAPSPFRPHSGLTTTALLR